MNHGHDNVQIDVICFVKLFDNPNFQKIVFN